MVLSFRWIGGILQLSFGITNLAIEYLDCPEDGVDIIPEGDCAIMIFRCLLIYFDRHISIELVLSGIGLC